MKIVLKLKNGEKKVLKRNELADFFIKEMGLENEPEKKIKELGEKDPNFSKEAFIDKEFDNLTLDDIKTRIKYNYNGYQMFRGEILEMKIFESVLFSELGMVDLKMSFLKILDSHIKGFNLKDDDITLLMQVAPKIDYFSHIESIYID
tara:strand:- start:72 stop:515 length:444 start_codon:yes stop_codon:yes gene_type:complete